MQRAREARRLYKESVEEKKEWVAYYKEKGLNDVQAQQAANKQLVGQKVAEGAKSVWAKIDAGARQMARNNAGSSVMGGGLMGSGMLGGGTQRPPSRKRKGGNTNSGIFGVMGY